MTMPLPFVIDNLAHRLVDTLKDLLGQSAARVPGRVLLGL